jgi:hypothetical protein
MQESYSKYKVMDKAGKYNAESWTSPTRGERLSRDEPPVIAPAITEMDLSLPGLYNYVIRTMPEQPATWQIQPAPAERASDYSLTPVDHRPTNANVTPVVHDYRPETSDAYRSTDPMTDDMKAWDVAMAPEYQVPAVQDPNAGVIDLHDESYTLTPEYLADDATQRAQAARMAADQARNNPLFEGVN